MKHAESVQNRSESLCAGLWAPCRVFWAWFGPALGPIPVRSRRFPAGSFKVLWVRRVYPGRRQAGWVLTRRCFVARAAESLEFGIACPGGYMRWHLSDRTYLQCSQKLLLFFCGGVKTGNRRFWVASRPNPAPGGLGKAPAGAPPDLHRFSAL